MEKNQFIYITYSKKNMILLKKKDLFIIYGLERGTKPLLTVHFCQDATCF